jgi:Cu-Zn family superoxide dismutase
MRAILALCMVVLLSSCAQAPLKARAMLVNATGAEVGTAAFIETPEGVRIEIVLANPSHEGRAVHIHETGVCEPPDFLSAGAHFNPEGRKHGLLNPEGPHAGDLQNFAYDADDEPTYIVLNSRVTLGSGKNSLLKAGGTALVMHETYEDHTTDPSGNAGARIVCGVIAKE